MSLSSNRKRPSRTLDDSLLQCKRIKYNSDDDDDDTSSSTITIPDDDNITVIPKTPPPPVLDEKSFLSAGGDSPYFAHLDETIACDDTPLPHHHHFREINSTYHRYSAIDVFTRKIHCHSVLCEGLQVKSWHNSMKDCINNLIDNKDRVKDIDWVLCGKRFVTMIWDEEEYLEAYDRLRKTCNQRFPMYYHEYMEALPDDAHIRAIRGRYSMKHLAKLSYYDIHWWTKYIIWGDLLDDLDYIQQYNIRYWLQAYQSLRLMMSKIPTDAKRVDSTGKQITFPLAYHPLSLKFEHRLFHKAPSFVADCCHCKTDQECYERFEVYN